MDIMRVTLLVISRKVLDSGRSRSQFPGDRPIWTRYYLTTEKTAAMDVCLWSTAPHVEDGMGLTGKKGGEVP
jgi:hypothetical protein